jgi:uncharacterized protein (DUF1015 family)
MASVFPFRAYRYSAQAGDLARLVTQPYDKITAEMQERYYALSPHNLVRIILGRAEPSDTASNSVYTRAATCFQDWIASGILAREPEPAMYAYFQRFQPPDAPPGAMLERQGLIAAGAVEDYSQGTVYRHELTHSGPKRDRLELLRQTRAHFGQIFMLYDDPQMAVDALLERARQGPRLACVFDEYGVEHSLWRIGDPHEIEQIQRLLAPHKLLIADGHHRYETALEYQRLRRATNAPSAPQPYDYAMITLVSCNDPGLVILPTHRIVRRLDSAVAASFAERARANFGVERIGDAGALLRALREHGHGSLAVALREGRALYLLRLNDAHALESLLPAVAAEVRELDVSVLHALVFDRIFGLRAEEIRAGGNLEYMIDGRAAIDAALSGNADGAFLMNPPSIADVERVCDAGATMPEKSTYFFPKLLTGLVMYPLNGWSAP